MSRTISIVVPALNEELNLQGSIDAIVQAASRVCDDYEVIVVNDGSADRTAEIARENARRNPRVRLLEHDSPRGFGAGYDTGRRSARMGYCVMVHGDDAFGADTLERLFSCAGKAEVVCGYIENPESRSLLRRVVSRFYTRVLNFLFRLNLRYYNGLQIHPTAWLRGVELRSKGFSFQAELLVRSLQEGRTCVEVPTRHRERPRGGRTKIFKLRNLVSMAATMAALYAERPSAVVRSRRQLRDAGPDAAV